VVNVRAPIGDDPVFPFLLCAFLSVTGGNAHPRDTIATSAGPLTITFVGHGTLILEIGGYVIHADPWSKLADYSALPHASCILITHHHQDHLDTGAIGKIRTPETVIYGTAEVAEGLKGVTVLRNGDTASAGRFHIEAVPAYNTTEGREKYHPKGRDNGYVLTIGGKRIYIAGDTELTPEMAGLKDIDIAFLPMNQPYTMLPAQVAAAVGAFHPRILYPYHTGETNIEELKKLLSGNHQLDLRIRPMK
jgi:L-ascorbate metabolism protein UlaG (beta-lactamase superfamily)